MVLFLFHLILVGLNASNLFFFLFSKMCWINCFSLACFRLILILVLMFSDMFCSYLVTFGCVDLFLIWFWGACFGSNILL